MLALLASFFLIAYVLVPGVIFRLAFSLVIPLKKFQRTRTQEVIFSAVTSVAPFSVACLFASLPWLDIQNVFNGSLDSSWLSADRDVFWRSVGGLWWGQLPFWGWYYGATILLALVLGWLARGYGKWQDKAFYNWFASTFLIPNVSEWYMLLEPFTEPKAKVVVDILTSDDHLYRGEVGDYFENAQSELTGILLRDAIRFDFRGYLAEKKQGNNPSKEKFWKQIPGTKFYVTADKITTLNISYEPSAESIGEMLKEFQIPATVRVES